MKKVFLILILFLAANLSASAVVTPEEVTSRTYLDNHGHSDEMARLIDLQHSQINGVPVSFDRKEPAYYADKKVNFVRRVFMYFDGGLDDQKFMQHKIKYTNRYDSL